jgi:hypothetical protein
MSHSEIIAMKGSSSSISDIWISMIKSLLQRLLISTSYSAVSQIQKSLTLLPAYSSRDLFALASLCVFSAVAICLKTSNHGFKGVFSMLAAQSLTSTLPIPQEQNSRLVLPGILLYFSSVSSLIWMMLVFFKPNDNNGNALETLNTIVDYIVLFAASRGLARFKATYQMHALGIMSMVFLLFPRSGKKESLGRWSHQFLQVLECLAVRGVILWITSGIKSFTGVTGPLPILLLNWALLIWNPFTLTTQFAECGGVLSLMSAQQSAELLQKYVHSSVGASVFLVLLSWLVHWSVCPHLVCNVCRLGISIAMTSWLEKWVREISPWLERFFVYVVVFVILEYLIRESEKYESIQVSEKETVLVECDDINKTSVTSENDMGIAHAQSMLGLPQVLDARGNH